MELKAILLFTEFPYVNVLYRAFDGEYFVELDDVQAYLIGVGGGAYTVINRTTPLPPLPEPLPEDSPIWVLINNPNVISNGLRYDGVISYTTASVGFTGNINFTVNKVGAFRVGNYVLAVSRKGASVGMSKYGKITAIVQNVLTINFLEFEGTGNLTTDEWDIVLTGRRGLQGIQGISGVTGLIHNSTSDPNINTVANVGDLFLNTTTGTLYEKSAMTQAEFFASGLAGLVLSNSIWINRGNLKGVKGDDGIDGEDAISSFEILTGTGVYSLSNSQLGKTLIVKADSAITGIRYNNVTIAGSTIFLSEKNLTITKTNQSPATGIEIAAGEYFVIDNYLETQNGFWLIKKSLKGENGNNFHSLLKLEYANFLTTSLDSNNYLFVTLSSEFALFNSIARNFGRFVGFIFNTVNSDWDKLDMIVDEVITNGSIQEVTFLFGAGFKSNVDAGLYQLNTLKIFLAGFDFAAFPIREKLIADASSNTFTNFADHEIIRFLVGYAGSAFGLPSVQDNASYRGKSYKLVRIGGGDIQIQDNNTQTTIAVIGLPVSFSVSRSVELYCDLQGNWKIIGF